jgi:hypothetical protein
MDSFVSPPHHAIYTEMASCTSSVLDCLKCEPSSLSETDADGSLWPLFDSNANSASLMRIAIRLLTVNADAIEAIVVDSLSSNRYVPPVIGANSLSCQGCVPRTTFDVRLIPIRQYRNGRIKLLLGRRTDPHPLEKFDPPLFLQTRPAGHTRQPPPDSLGSIIEMFRRASRPR